MVDERRQSILNAAHEVFSRFGYKKSSIDDIAKKAGVAKGSIYSVAKSKAELYYEVLLRAMRDWNAAIARELDPAAPADEQLMQSALRAILIVDDHPLVKGFLIAEPEVVLPHIESRMEDLQAVGRGYIIEILRTGVRQGIFREELDLDIAAGLLLEIHAAGMLFHMRKGPPDPDWLMRRMATAGEILLRGLTVRES